MSESVQTVAPTASPVTLGDLRAHLRITGHDEDAYLQALIDMAVDALQAKAWRQFCTATYTMQFDDWADELRLPRPPLATVTSVKYYDTSEVLQTLATSVYEVITDQTPGLIRLKYQQTWPALRGHPDDILITYTCGSSAAAVPSRTKQAVKLLAAHHYQQRTPVVVGRTVVEIPMGIMWLLDRSGVPV
ncbi:MAG TPA: phage head-tail connector protein [Thermoguttaceae bacterium]|nr:phage head-tail connector protein [Thermoguttaceae bacterium]